MKKRILCSLILLTCAVCIYSASYTAGDFIYASAANTLNKLAKGTANQVLGMNNGATAPEYKTVTAGTGITVTHGANSITIAASAGTVSAGTYTPTLFNVANLDGSTAYACQYLQVGATVTVSGRVDVDPTTTLTDTQLGISLPVASALTQTYQAGGTAFAPAIAAQGAAILGDATNDRVTMQWKAADVTSQPMYFSFTYQVL